MNRKWRDSSINIIIIIMLICRIGFNWYFQLHVRGIFRLVQPVLGEISHKIYP